MRSNRCRITANPGNDRESERDLVEVEGVLNQETAERVRDILMQFRAGMRELHHAVQESSTAEEFAQYNDVLRRVFHNLHGKVLERIYTEHPDIRKNGW